MESVWRKVIWRPRALIFFSAVALFAFGFYLGTAYKAHDIAPPQVGSSCFPVMTSGNCFAELSGSGYGECSNNLRTPWFLAETGAMGTASEDSSAVAASCRSTLADIALYHGEKGTDSLKILQDAVNEGHQPWRLDPWMVLGQLEQCGFGTKNILAAYLANEDRWHRELIFRIPRKGNWYDLYLTKQLPDNDGLMIKSAWVIYDFKAVLLR